MELIGTEPRFQVMLSEKEMQCLASAVAAFYNVMNQDKNMISPEQTVMLQVVMEKFKKAINPIEVIQ